MTKQALIVVDIQNDYFAGGKWILDGVDAAADNAFPAGFVGEPVGYAETWRAGVPLILVDRGPDGRDIRRSQITVVEFGKGKVGHVVGSAGRRIVLPSHAVGDG